MTFEDSKRHKRLLYKDTESTFWAGPPPRGPSHEIIEIGVVEMDTANLKIIREQSYFARPKR